MFCTWPSVCFEAGGEVLITTEENGEGIHGNCMDSTIPEGGKYSAQKMSCYYVH
jgi:hypothetical protein